MIALSKPVSLVTMVMFCKTSLASKRSVDFEDLAGMIGISTVWECDCGKVNPVNQWKCQNPKGTGCGKFRVHTAAFKAGLERELKELETDRARHHLFEDGLQAIRDHLQAQNPDQFRTVEDQLGQKSTDEVDERADPDDGDEKKQPDSADDGNELPPAVDGSHVQEPDDVSDAPPAEGGEARRCEAVKKIMRDLRACGYCCISALGTFCLVSQISEWCSQEDCCSASFQALFRCLLCCGHGGDIVEQVVLFCNCVGGVLRDFCDCLGNCCDSFAACCGNCGDCDCGGGDCIIS